MSPRSVTSGDNPEVFVDTVYGNLQAEGWERAEILLNSSDDEAAKLRQDGGVFHVKTMGDCLLHVPQRSKLAVTSVHGGARIQMLESSITIGRVLGSLALDEVGETQVESVYGELLVKSVAGGLTIDQVLGNIWISDIQGDCTIERVAGDLEVRNAEGDLRASARGNARVSLEDLGGKSYKIEASGSIVFRVQEEINARVLVSSGAREITLSLPDGKRVINDKTYELTLGDGAASIVLSAGGSVTFSCQEASLPGEWEASQAEVSESFARISEEFSQKITEEVESQLETQIKVLDEQMAHLAESIARSGLAPDEAERILRRAQESSERANVRAQEKMRRAREKLDRKLAAAQRKIEERERNSGRRKESQEQRTWSFEWPAPASPAQRDEGMSDAESMMILRMLEQKKITLAEAEQLLEALEGKSA